MVLVNTPVLICKELLTIPVGNIVGANDAEVPVNALNCVELDKIPVGNKLVT
jgi:hypothetical protein